MTDEKEPTLADVLEAQRATYRKLLEIERKLDKAEAQGSLGVVASGKKKPNPQHVLLQGRLLSEWLKAKGEKYSFAPRDAKAISSLLKRSMTIDELVARWCFAFKNGCSSIFEFEMNFNKYIVVRETGREQVTAGVDLYSEKKP